MSEPLPETRRVLLALRAQRLQWVELAPGREVQIRRPHEAEMHRLTAGIGADHVCEFVVDWRGFSEATILGEAIGSSDPFETFDPELWADYVRDNTEEVTKVAKAIAAAVKAHLAQRKAIAKNSIASSTPALPVSRSEANQ